LENAVKRTNREFTLDEKSWAHDNLQSPMGELIKEWGLQNVDFEVDDSDSGLYETNLGYHPTMWIKGHPKTAKLVRLDTFFAGAVENDDIKGARRYYNQIQRWKDKK